MSANFSLLQNKSHVVVGVIITVISLMPFLGGVSPRLYGFIPMIVGVLGLFAYWRPSVLFQSLYFRIILTISALVLLSSLWSLAPPDTVKRGVKIALILLGGFGLYNFMRFSPQMDRPKVARWFNIGFVTAVFAGGVFCAFELYTGAIINNSWKGLPANTANVSNLNRAVLVFVITLPVCICFLMQLDTTKFRKILLVAVLLLITLLMLSLTDSQSSHMVTVVMIISALIFPLMHYKASWFVLTLVFCAGAIGFPWIAQYGYQHYAEVLYTSSWASSGYASDRLEIWDFVARKALENPLYGFGLEATRYIEHFDTPLLYTPLDHVLHPHNFVMQIWIEFGVIGVAGLCAFIALVFKTLSTCEYDTARLGFIVFMALMAASCTAYGLWQSWWLGYIVFAVALCGYHARHKSIVDIH